MTETLEGLSRVGTFQVLSYRFDVQADGARTRRYIAEVLQAFAQPPGKRHRLLDDPVARYAVEDVGEEETTTRYRLHHNGEWILGSGVKSHVLDRLFWHINERALEDNEDYLLIHAGAVVGPSGRAVLLPADSGSGKTTLVTGLLKRGFRYLSDEAAALDPATFLVHPFAKPLSIKPGTQALFPDLKPHEDYVDLADGYWHVDPRAFGALELSEPAGVGLIVCPSYSQGAEAALRSLSPAQACLQLGRQVINLDVWKARALPILARLARDARCYELVSGDPDGAAGAVVALTEST